MWWSELLHSFDFSTTRIRTKGFLSLECGACSVRKQQESVGSWLKGQPRGGNPAANRNKRVGSPTRDMINLNKSLIISNLTKNEPERT